MKVSADCVFDIEPLMHQLRPCVQEFHHMIPYVGDESERAGAW